MDFIEDFNLLEIYSDYVKEPFFLNLEEIIDLFDTSSIEKTKERIKILFTENAEFLIEKMFSKNEIFYRGRVGFNNEKGAIDDCDINVTFPYYGSQISEPPTSMSRAGRFNRSSYSYLYMATSKETCISELKLDVGQFCSIAEFKPVNKGRFLDLSANNGFIHILNRIILVPITEANKHLYYVTQVFSDVIKELGYRGIVYPSSKSISDENFNIVSFYPKDFEYIEFSENMYSVQKISYTIKKEEESFRKYKDYETLLNSYSQEENYAKEAHFDYLDRKIEYEKEELNKAEK